MHLVFVDQPSRLSELSVGDVLVATEPEVEIVAAQQGRDYVRLWGHVDPLGLEADAEAGYEPLVRACAAFDSQLGSGASASWHLREIKVVLEGVRSRWLAAESLVAALAPSTATLMLQGGTLAHDVLAHGLPALGLEVRSSTVAAPAATVPPVETSRAARLRGWLSWHRRPPRRSGSPLVVCSDTLYGVEPIAAALRARGADVRLLVPPPIRTPPPVLPRAGLDAFAGLFAVGRVDLAPVGLPRIASLLERGLPESAAAYEGALRALERFAPAAVLGSAFEAPRLKAVAAAARMKHVPVVVSRHGEMGARHDPSGAYQDIDAIDIALCWGELEARQVAEYASRPIRTVVVGAPSIETETAPERALIRAELGFGEAEVLVLYLPVAFDRGAWLANRAAPNESDHLLHQRRILSALASVPGITPVLKTAPTSPGGIVNEWLFAAAPHARVVSGHPYSELVHLADAVVVDFPSTTLVQALRGSARIFIADHRAMIWTTGVREHLTRYGVVFAEPGKLTERLAGELAGGLLEGPHTYPKEAIEPLLASGPGTAAERAVDAILHIVSEQPGTTIESR